MTNSGDAEVEVVIERLINGEWMAVEGPTALAPLATLESLRPSGAEIVYWGVQAGVALRIRSTGPVVAHQFNTGEGGGRPYGASTLLPSTNWDWDYRVLSMGSGIFEGDNANYAVVVAREDQTLVEVTLRDSVLHSGPGIPAGLEPGDSFQAQLDAGEALGLFSADADYRTVDGVAISSAPDHPIAVFAGQQGGYEGRNEDQLLGVNRWGSEHACPHLAQPNTVVTPIEWRIMGREPTTFVEFVGSQFDTYPQSPAPVMTPGYPLDYTVETSHLIISTKPIGVTPTMLGWVQGNRRHSTASLPPIERWLDRYVIYVPEGPWSESSVTLVRPLGVEVELDGVAVPGAESSSFAEEWETVRFPISPGAHELESNAPFLALVHGRYDNGDNYVYLAGVELGG